jgi:opacity protein-like surface antigen
MSARTIGFAKSAFALVAAVAVTLSVAASAQADANVSVSFDGHIRGLATFFSIGDEFRICDRRRDNLPVGVRYSYIRKNGTTQRGQHWYSMGVGGVGEPDSHGYREKGCSYDDHNFGEGRRVWFQACVGQPEEGHFTCSKTQVTSTGPK